MDQLKQKFGEKSAAIRSELRALVKDKGNMEVDSVSLGQIYGGMRGVKSMIWETSSLDPIEGIKFRGYSIPALREKLPKINGSTESTMRIFMARIPTNKIKTSKTPIPVIPVRVSFTEGLFRKRVIKSKICPSMGKRTKGCITEPGSEKSLVITSHSPSNKNMCWSCPHSR